MEGGDGCMWRPSMEEENGGWRSHHMSFDPREEEGGARRRRHVEEPKAAGQGRRSRRLPVVDGEELLPWSPLQQVAGHFGPM
ncbi:unnamed protein product [Rhodiola kirilowii]